MSKSTNKALGAPSQRRRGFTLIEIMIAVSILGLLATIAWPHYHASVFRAQRVEAIVNLESINTAQLSYYGTYDQFASSFEDLDYGNVGEAVDAQTFETKRYTYVMSQPWGAKSWLCTATADLDGDPWPDQLAAFERL